MITDEIGANSRAHLFHLRVKPRSDVRQEKIRNGLRAVKIYYIPKSKTEVEKGTVFLKDNTNNPSQRNVQHKKPKWILH